MASGRYLPPVDLILRGLGIQSLPDDGSTVTVSARFLRQILAELARAAVFDTEFYARENPDAVHGVANGYFESLHEHFATNGFFEGRLPAPQVFDAAWYAQRYPDLESLSPAELEEHYVEAGRLEGRAANSEEIAAERWATALHDSVTGRDLPDLAHCTIEEARVQAFEDPVIAPSVDPPPHGFCGGPVLGNSRLDLRLRHNRARAAVDCFASDAEYDHHLAGSWIYGGPAYDHFGHVMAEMIHRLLPSRRLFGEQNVLLVGTYDDVPTKDFDSLPEFYKEILLYLEIDPERVTVLHQNHVIERLHIAEQGSDFGGGPKPGYLRELRAFSEARLASLGTDIVPAEKVYVSRSSIVPSGGLLGETYFEDALRGLGFTIFHPEEHSLAVQLTVYHNAKVLIFAEGSACHGTELLGEQMLGTCALLTRRQDYAEFFGHILAPRAKSFVHVPGSIEVGTVVAHPETGEPLPNYGVSLLDIDRLTAFLVEHGLGKPADFNRAGYAESAGRDFESYVRWHRMDAAVLSDQAILTVYDRLSELLEAYR